MDPKKCEDDVLEDPDDPIIRMADPLLEASVPEGEAQMFAALRYNDIDMIERQLRAGFDINSKHTGLDQYRLKSPSMAHRVQTNSYAPLHIAALHSTLKVIKLLLMRGADVNILDEQHRTPLHFAVVAERVSVINMLIQHGANIDIQSSSGRTPLLEAAFNDSVECCRLLIQAGANLDLADTKGTSLLHHLCFARLPRLDLVSLVLKKGGNINITNFKGATPLMFAVAMKNLKLLDMLVKNGANINQADHHGRTAIHFVIEHKSTVGRMGILLYLVHHGAGIYGCDKSGVSLLQKAIKNSSVAAIKLLLLAECKRQAEQFMEQEQIKYLCDVIPAFKQWLLQELGTPKSLLRCCRQTIRYCIPQDRLTEVSSLDLPRQLQDYLLVRDLTPEDVG